MSFAKLERQSRHHIQSHDVKYWSKRWKVSAECIRVAIEKIGNSVSAVHKELCLEGLIDNAALEARLQNPVQGANTEKSALR